VHGTTKNKQLANQTALILINEWKKIEIFNDFTLALVA